MICQPALALLHVLAVNGLVRIPSRPIMAMWHMGTLYHEHTNAWLTVHFLLRDLLHGTLYRSNFVAHPLTARFVAVLKHFYFLSFIPSDVVFYSLHFSLAIFIARRP